MTTTANGSALTGITRREKLGSITASGASETCATPSAYTCRALQLSLYDVDIWLLRFDAFYRAQGFLHDEDWNSFLTALRTPLPASFRLNPNYQFKDRLQKELYELGKSIAAAGDAEGAGALRPAVEPLEWFEGGSAFKLSADRRAIHRTAGLEELHKWMIEHTENGNITRQEAVSMVPPLALNVKPHHRCLDMCAAPGSKTTQILEVIAGGTDDTDENTIVAEKGMVVANDADANR